MAVTSYKVHNFKAGDYLYAAQMRDIDDAIEALFKRSNATDNGITEVAHDVDDFAQQSSAFVSGIDATTSESDFNAMVLPGCYIVGPNTKNNPLNDDGYLIVYGSENGSNSILCQLLLSKDGRISSRWCKNLVWSPWHSSISTEEVENIVAHVKIRGDQLAIDKLLVEDFLQIGKDGITKLTNDSITTGTVIAKLVEADEGDFKALRADSALIRGVLQVGESGITKIANDTITTDTVISNIIKAGSAELTNLTSNTAFVQTMLQVGESGITRIANDTITTDTVLARLAEVDVLHSDKISANSAFVRSLQAISVTEAEAKITDAYIYNAVAGKIAVADLKAGDIYISNSARIMSENGAMVMTGDALQIYGTDSLGNDYVGVQLGYDAESIPSLILRNADGAVVISPQGVTEHAIPDGLIRNDMVQNGTLGKEKFSFTVMEEGDTISMEQIYMGDKAFGGEWTSFTTGTNQALDDLSEAVADSAKYDVVIETPDGVDIRGGNIRLVARLYRNGVDVTDSYDASLFIWTRNSSDSAGDTVWNQSHSTGTKQLLLTGTDVNKRVRFNCRFRYDRTAA